MLLLDHKYKIFRTERLGAISGKTVIYKGTEDHPLLGIMARVIIVNDDGSAGEEWLVRSIYLMIK